MQFLRDCIVKNCIFELCSLDVQKSSVKAVASLSQRAKIFSLAIQAKKKEAVRKICSWESVNCVDTGVRFISANIRDYDLQSLFFMTVKLINGVAHMFPGPRYLPLRLKSIKWLNLLSSSSGTFIPVASLVLDVLEYKVSGEGRKAQIAFNTTTVLKWSYHISFPDLATIPVIRLRRILEITTVESLCRIVKRMIDQVEQNAAFVQKKRENAPFSPLDHQSADSFLQLEKSSPNAPFTQYYRSVLEKACERKLHKFDKKSLTELKTSKTNAAKHKRKPVAVDVHVDAEDQPAENGMVNSKRRKRVLEAQ